MISESWREDFYGYIAGIIKNKTGRMMCIGGTEDHIHNYLSLPGRISLSSMVNAIKSNSSRWARAKHAKGFAWQRGFGAFSMNLRNEDYLRRYIANQKKHHKSRSSKREYLAMMAAHRIPITEDVLD